MVNTSGVKDTCSTSTTRLSYILFFLVFMKAIHLIITITFTIIMIIIIIIIIIIILSLHTAAEPAVRSAVKILVSLRNDTITAFFFAAYKNKTVHKFLWPLLVVNLSIPGLI